MASPDESAATQTASVNTLGLELEQLTVSPSQPDDAPVKEEAVSTPTDPESKDKDKRGKEKEKPYHNPDRVLTGGSQRVRLIHGHSFFLHVLIRVISRTNSLRMS